jgi:hypothetical protein
MGAGCSRASLTSAVREWRPNPARGYSKTRRYSHGTVSPRGSDSAPAFAQLPSWQAARRLQIVRRALSPEIERAFFERVGVANHQNRDETEHAPEDQAALFDRVPINHCPRIHENNLEIEKDKEHRH